MLAGTFSNIDDIIGGKDRVFVMFDDDKGIPQVAHLFERCDKAVVVPLMKTDGRLVENIEDPQSASIRSVSQDGCAGSLRRKASKPFLKV